MKNKDLVNYYNHEFYKKRDELTEYSALKILGIMHEYFNFESIADIGGGIGTFLKVGQKLWGINWERVSLYEGDYVEKDLLVIPSSCFHPTDLEVRLDNAKAVDLAISLEVAEHLSPERANLFVEDLCNLSEVVLFSAAAKGQGGEHHVNEQKLSYWINLFEQFGYCAFDLVRPLIQYDKRIPFWYRQNCIIFVKKESDAFDRLVSRAKWMPPLDMVSYDMIKDKIKILDTFGKTFFFRAGYKIYRIIQKLKKAI